MRRFVDTFAGKALCHLAVVALVLPTATLGVVRRAEAQVQQLPSWAVTELKDLKGGKASKYGQAAADAVNSELAKTNRYDVVPQESVKRSIETLQLDSPPEGLVNLERVGQDVRATTIVAGEVIDYRVDPVGGGKQARVALRLVAYDVSSGLPVNGALEEGQSIVRSGNVTNDTLINDAIQQASAIAVRTMGGQQLPTATVLNTTSRTALINQGTRSGFKSGDTVIITRGSQQVGVGRVGQIEPDQAEMTPERNGGIGIAPGDKVRAVFNPPALPTFGTIFNEGKGLKVANHPRRNSNNSTLISALLVVGLLAVLLGSGNNSNGTGSTASFSAQAALDPGTGQPAVHLNWSGNGFFKGNGNTGEGVQLWQIFRTDVSNTPVLVYNGTARSGLDSSSGADSNSVLGQGYFVKNSVTGNDTTQCVNTSSITNAGVTETLLSTTTGLRSYTYSIEAVYSVLAISLPNGTTGQSTSGTTSGTTSSTAGGTSSGTTSGTTAGGTTAGTTAGGTSAGSTATAGGTTSTAGSTAGGGTTSGGSGTTQDCYFVSSRTSSGLATPLPRPVLATQSTGRFPFTEAFNSNGNILLQSVIEFSDSQFFPKNHTVTQAGSALNSLFFAVTTTTGDFLKVKAAKDNKTLLSVALPLYYRIGVRNAQDRPGPVGDSIDKQPYIFSAIGTVTRVTGTTTPPAP